MRVCLFGPYVMSGMNLVLKKRLELQGIEIVECQEEIHKKLISIIPAYIKLYLKHRKLDYDIMIIPRWRGGLALPLAKTISRKPIVYVVYSSPYDILVTDRQTFKPKSFMGRFIRFWYKQSMRFSDVIIKESNSDIEYNAKEFGIDKKKIMRLFLSANEELFPVCPFKILDETFTVLYFGSFNPLHGTETIIESAKILSENKGIIFKLCGYDDQRKPIEELVRKYNLKNIKFLGFVDQETLANNIKNADICLGIFSDNNRAQRVITNKVYQILCSQKPLITMKSETVKEINLENEKNCFLRFFNNFPF